MTALPSWLDAELWAAYVAQRKKDKKEMSPRSARDRLVRLYALRDAGHDPNQCLAEALNGHWLDFYEPHEKPISRVRKPEFFQPDPKPTPEEREASLRVRKEVMEKLKGKLRRVA